MGLRGVSGHKNKKCHIFSPAKRSLNHQVNDEKAQYLLKKYRMLNRFG